MSNKWMDFLTSCGATFNEQREIEFKTEVRSLSGDLLVTDLSWLGLLEVSGEDQKTFLQGQLTNDINAISSTLSHLSGLCTPKGRLRALFTIVTRKGSLYLQLPYTMLEDNLKRLKMFVLMSKVELNNVSDELVRIGIAGDKAEKYLQEAGFTIPSQTNIVSENNDMQLIRLAGSSARFQCIGSIDAISKLWQKLSDNAQLINSSHWRLLDILSGTPNVFPETNEIFIPQMLNLQALNGISFKKGCYTGQEVVARMQYLGKLKRRMYLAHCDSEELPVPGTELHSATSTSGQGSGNIVDAQASPRGGIDLLAVITNDAAENQDIYLDETLKIPLIIQELPYSLEND